MSRLDKPKPHDEDVAFECPCGGLVVGRFVLPTQDGHYAIMGGCPACVARGKSKTSIAYLKASGNSELLIFNRFRVTSPFVFRRGAT